MSYSSANTRNHLTTVEGREQTHAAINWQQEDTRCP